MRRIIGFLCTIIIFTFLTQFGYAADRNPFLAEISSFQIVVEEIPQYLQATGITETDIRERVEFICRRNSLPLNPSAKSALYVQVNGGPSRVGGRDIGVAYAIQLLFIQAGKTMVNGTPYPIRSWNGRLLLGIAPPNSFRHEIQDDLQTLVEQFANVWLASHER